MKELKKDPTRISRGKMRKVFNDLTKAMMAEVQDGGKIYIHRVGRIYVKFIKVPLMEEGEINPMLPINWKATFEYWEKLYPGVTSLERKSIKNKPLLKFINDHTKQYVAKHMFLRTFFLEDQSWRFDFCTKNKRALGKIIKEGSNKRAFIA